MSGVVTVEIAGQRYRIRSELDQAYVAELAAYVERKVRAASDSAPAADIQGLAVLAALNIADELFQARSERGRGSDSLNARALKLEALVDRVLTP